MFILLCCLSINIKGAMPNYFETKWGNFVNTLPQKDYKLAKASLGKVCAQLDQDAIDSLFENLSNDMIYIFGI